MSKKLKLSALVFLLSIPFLLPAQRYFSRNANVSFDATTNSSLETIAAKTSAGTMVVDAPTGKVEAAVLMKGFQFEKALMQEHFNENYVESSKYPKAVFKGKIVDASKLDFAKDGTYNVQLSGDLTMHGITKQIAAPAVFNIKNGKVSGQTDFSVALNDFGISVPSLVSDKLAKEAKVTFGGDLELMK
jgi:polyisoprenoid-binding protein YceI